MAEPTGDERRDRGRVLISAIAVLTLALSGCSAGESATPQPTDAMSDIPPMESEPDGDSSSAGWSRHQLTPPI